MANTVSVLSYANTFGDWVVTTNRLTAEVNDIGFNNYIKPTGTLFLNSPTLGLQVANNAVIQGQLQVIGTGSSAYIQNNLEVNSGQVYFSNTVLGLTNQGQAIFNGRVNANGPLTGLAVANNTTIGGYVRVSSNAAVVGPTALSNTLSVVGVTTLGNTLSVLRSTTLSNTLSVAENATFSNNISVVNRTSTSDLFAQNNSNTGTLNVRSDGSFGANVGVVGTIFSNVLQANTNVNTTRLNVTGLTFTNALQSNTSVNTTTLSVTGNTFTNTLQSNTWVNTPLVNTNDLYSTQNIIGDVVRANTSLSTTNFLASGSAIVNSLQANTSVNTAVITATGSITGSNLRSNNGISATTSAVSGQSISGTFVANTSVTTPVISVNTRIDANGAIGYFDKIQTTGRLSVGGDFIINGDTVQNSPNLTLSSNSPNQTSTFNVYRSPGANATIRWTEVGGYWDIRDVSTGTFHRIITEQQLTNSLTTVSSILGASATAANTLNTNINTLNGFLTSNVTSLQNQITSNTASLQNQITSNVTSLQAQITSNAAISQAGINASYARANTSSNTFVGTSGVIVPNNGVISLASNNGVVISATGNTLFVNTPQNLRTTDSPTYNALTLTNALPITSGGTGASDKNTGLFNLVPTTSGVPAGYVLATGGGGGSSFYWAAGGTGGGGGATPGTTIASSRATATGNGTGLSYSTPVYVPGTAQLRAFINGVRQFPSEYTETSGNTGGVGIVTFTTSPQVNDNIIFEVDGYIINPYFANNISFTANPTIGTSANTIQLAIDGLTTLAAPKASPTFTGTPAAPTASVGTNTTQLATTKFVNDSLNAGTGTTYVMSVSGNAGTTSQTNFTNLTIGGSQVVSATNYNTYAPTLTGTGASGNWNINAAQLGGLNLQSSGTAPVGAQILRTDISGSTWTGYINSNTNNTENPTISQVIVTNGTDNFYRKAGIGHLTSAIQSNASGTWGISISGLAATATQATNATNAVNATTATTANALNVSNSYKGVSFNSQGTTNFIASGIPATANSSIYNYNGIASNTTSFGISTNNNGGVYTFDGSGNFVASGSITSFSDTRLKTNIHTITGALDKVNSMRGVFYDKDGVRNTGVIAQEIREILPEVVFEGADEDKLLSVSYGNIVGVLIEAVKELKAEIEVLKGNSK
jgi:hypothetical protein